MKMDLLKKILAFDDMNTDVINSALQTGKGFIN